MDPEHLSETVDTWASCQAFGVGRHWARAWEFAFYVSIPKHTNCSLRTKLPSTALFPAVLSLSWSMLAPVLWTGAVPLPWVPPFPSSGLASGLWKTARAQGTAWWPGGGLPGLLPTSLPLCAMERCGPSAEQGACPAARGPSLAPLLPCFLPPVLSSAGSFMSSVAPNTISEPGDIPEMSVGRVDIRSDFPG